MMSGQDLMRKVSGLLRKAEGTDNEHEAAAFFEAAHALMIKHSIEEQKVREAMGASSRRETPNKHDFMFSTNDAQARGKASLLNAVAQHYGVKFIVYQNRAGSNMWRSGNSGRYSQWGVFVGFDSDIESVKTLYVSLIIQQARFGAHDWRMMYGTQVKGRFGFMSGHLLGFASRIANRFEEMKEKQKPEEFGLMVRRDNEVLEAAQTFFPDTYTPKTRKVDVLGYLAGDAAGRRADIGTGKIRTPSTGLLGGG